MGVVLLHICMHATRTHVYTPSHHSCDTFEFLLHCTALHCTTASKPYAQLLNPAANCSGYPIEQLTDSTYLESAYLVLYGSLPTRCAICPFSAVSRLPCSALLCSSLLGVLLFSSMICSAFDFNPRAGAVCPSIGRTSFSAQHSTLHSPHTPLTLSSHFCLFRSQLTSFSDAVSLHAGVPTAVEDVIAAMPHDAHPMAIILTGLTALSGCHPEQNPALAGQSVYRSREVQDLQIARLIGKVRWAVCWALCWTLCWALCCWVEGGSRKHSNSFLVSWWEGGGGFSKPV
jgi:Citrate synthase, C-terminal domain